MISYLKGKLIYKSPIEITIDVNGVGYLVFIPLSTFYALPEPGGEIQETPFINLQMLQLK